MRLTRILGTLLGPMILTAAANATAPCAEFKWDVSHERALFATQPTSITAGATPSRESKPSSVPVDRLVEVSLLPETNVSYVVAPEKKSRSRDGFGGIVRVSVPTPGRYRVAANAPAWIDWLADGKIVPTVDFDGQHDCTAPRKVVEFEVPQACDYLLQLSAAPTATLRLTLSASPAH